MSELSVYKGDDREWMLYFTDGAKNPINITGWTVYFTVKDNPDDPDTLAVIKKDITSHIDPTNGKTNLVLYKSETEISPLNRHYDIRVKKATGKVRTIKVDTFASLMNITRRSL